MSTRNHIPSTVEASLDARLAPFRGVNQPRRCSKTSTSRPPGPWRRAASAGCGSSLVNDLKLLFAALGAGGSVVPLGDNGRTARLLAEYAAVAARATDRRCVYMAITKSTWGVTAPSPGLD